MLKYSKIYLYLLSLLHGYGRKKCDEFNGIHSSLFENYKILSDLGVMFDIPSEVPSFIVS